ncbi:serine aminopeptidase domain-containing protein [Pelosinus fermentans]|uniref:Serine aminopeptidase S33 domain-containing protein n=1 Tax=Pelosinus fermentans JBW45 TaxID=1192197 RepID=I8TYZ4_9FIRM|nr:alpha/beta hydrolase [Pelosinus fermentans]AJQ26589.1 hypothetical protein JBW_01237 [Pelosinus fermentans JBW45]
MFTQFWLVNNKISLAAVSHRNDLDRKSVCGVVLIAGFSQPMCDVDYFMSKLARQLSNLGIFVLQVDPRGHGDSEGNLENVNLYTLREDLSIAVNFVAEQVGDKVFCIGRGLSATLFAEISSLAPIRGVVGISPYCIEPSIVSEIWANIKPGIFDVNDIMPGTDYKSFSNFDIGKIAFCNAIGALPYNLHGQVMSTEILFNLFEYKPLEVLKKCKDKSLWLLSEGKDNNRIVHWHLENEKLYPNLNNYVKNAIIRDPLWQYDIIERICNWIKKYK